MFWNLGRKLIALSSQCHYCKINESPKTHSIAQMNSAKGQYTVLVHWLWSSASLISSGNFILHHTEAFHIFSRINSLKLFTTFLGLRSFLQLSLLIGLIRPYLKGSQQLSTLFYPLENSNIFEEDMGRNNKGTMKTQHIREAVWGKSQATQTWAVMGLSQKAAQNQ